MKLHLTNQEWVAYYNYATIFQCFTAELHIKHPITLRLVDSQRRIPALIYLVLRKDPVTFPILTGIQESVVEGCMIHNHAQESYRMLVVISMRAGII